MQDRLGVLEPTAGTSERKAKYSPQNKAYCSTQGTKQSLNTIVDSLFSEIEIPRKDRNNADFMRDRAKAQKALLAVQNSNLAQQLAEVLKNGTTIRMSLPEYRSRLSFDIQLRFREFFVVDCSPLVTMYDLGTEASMAQSERH